MEEEITEKELIALMSAWEGDFLLQIKLKEDEADEKRSKDSD